MPRPVLPVVVDEELEDADPDQTVARDDWESTVIRRVAPRVAQVREEVESDDDRYGWENEGLRRLSRELQSKQVRGEG
ncbi:MAG TPA: hypothetical protein VHK24_01195 [Steroidobacter sp.]|nr:hypothetical protein [Steroidobacter sp.]